MPEYREKYSLFFQDDEGHAVYELSHDVTVVLAATLMNFERDEFKNDRLMLIEKLNKKMYTDLIPYNGDVFHCICHVYVESQQWEDITAFLRK